GRLERWQWSTTPPTGTLNPTTHPAKMQLLNLVNPGRGALIDHFMPLGTRPDEVAAGSHREYGDFVEEPYRSQAVDTGGEVRIGLMRDGSIRAGQRVAEVRLLKSAAVRPGSADIAVLYRVINSSLRPLQILFAIEFNLYAPGITAIADLTKGYYLIDGVRPEEPELGSSGVSPGATHLALTNSTGEMALQLGWDRECDIWRLPSADGGADVRILTVWRMQLSARDNWALGLWLAPG
ncbi:MAG: DUF1926 domain-containing protein, partial [Chloroflexota bacterium]|nr:DUF1926 domain-containing protein [Chloroflexota bacterium]